jgi:hypothetical protein
MTSLDFDRERRTGRVVGAAALLSFALTLAAVPLSGRGTQDSNPGRRPDKSNMLLDFHKSESDQLLAALAKGLGAALVIFLVVYLHRLTRARRAEHPRWLVYLGLAGCLMLVTTTLLGFFELREVARDFVASGPRTNARAKDLFDHATLLRMVAVLDLVGGLIFGIWISVASYEAQQTGLFTQSLMLFGVGAGLLSAIGIPVGPALFLGWQVSVGLLALGVWPGGRPPAWDTERAVPRAEADGAAVPSA